MANQHGVLQETSNKTRGFKQQFPALRSQSKYREHDRIGTERHLCAANGKAWFGVSLSSCPAHHPGTLSRGSSHHGLSADCVGSKWPTPGWSADSMARSGRHSPPSDRTAPERLPARPILRLADDDHVKELGSCFEYTRHVRQFKMSCRVAAGRKGESSFCPGG